MRSFCVLTAILVLTACAGAPEATTMCAQERPLVCTREFRPTCAVLAAGGTKDFASPCTACADAAVSGYVHGACPE